MKFQHRFAFAAGVLAILSHPALAQVAPAPTGNAADATYTLPASYYQTSSSTTTNTTAVTQAAQAASPTPPPPPAATTAEEDAKAAKKLKKQQAKAAEEQAKLAAAKAKEDDKAAKEAAKAEAKLASAQPAALTATPVAVAPAPVVAPVPVAVAVAPAVTTTTVTSTVAPAAEPAATPPPTDKTGTAGYDGGFFIKSKDGDFLLKFNGRIQPRFALLQAQNVPGNLDTSTFEVRRASFVFTGNIGSPKLSYQLAMAAVGDAMFVAGANLGYTFTDAFVLNAGYWILPYGHGGSSGATQMPEGTLEQGRFGPAPPPGITVSGAIKKFYYGLGIANNGSTASNVQNVNNEMVYAGQVGYNILGDANDGSEGDLANSPTPNLGIETSLALDHRETGTQSRVIDNQWYAQLKWHGFSTIVEWSGRLIDPDEFTQQQFDMGYTVQAGYFFIPKKLEFVLQTSATIDDMNGVGVNQETENDRVGHFSDPAIKAAFGVADSDNEYEYATGVNYFFNGNKFKTQLEYVFVMDGQAGPTERKFHVVIAQLQAGF